MAADYLEIARRIQQQRRQATRPEPAVKTDTSSASPPAVSSGDAVLSPDPSGVETADSEAPFDDTPVIDPVVYRTAIDMLNGIGARHIMVDGVFTIAIWASRDTEQIRWAAQSIHPEGVQIMHLEDHRVPERYRVRRGDYPDEFGTDWATWERQRLNAIFGRSPDYRNPKARPIPERGPPIAPHTKYEINEINEISRPDGDASAASGQSEGDSANLASPDGGDDAQSGGPQARAPARDVTGGDE
jgi:hypothetical protein